ncbi:MAG: hypothetical protein M1813_002514 [Trichoglossum hirsutum]|nr:MAG: hypothetical protein M1813_002514 [Trichoglossum hirsutum]
MANTELFVETGTPDRPTQINLRPKITKYIWLLKLAALSNQQGEVAIEVQLASSPPAHLHPLETSNTTSASLRMLRPQIAPPRLDNRMQLREERQRYKAVRLCEQPDPARESQGCQNGKHIPHIK